MNPLFSFLLGAAATALLTTDSGRKLADRIGELARSTVAEKYEETVAALKPRENEDVRDDAQEEKEREDERDA